MTTPNDFTPNRTTPSPKRYIHQPSFNPSSTHSNSQPTTLSKHPENDLNYLREAHLSPSANTILANRNEKKKTTNLAKKKSPPSMEKHFTSLDRRGFSCTPTTEIERKRERISPNVDDGRTFSGC
ncbi:hypothetical protein CEXT_562171 [Caerostris extrusa]|uniref:Uncharacterized protein n=1 Tax=Caerostris extrusa TaxID=172846 RepID=A0AAV4TM98_CAEEX|nr:hypothetical protein CEXT_562171 [Caerostris extrusa]